jgi:hypothetical protein
VTAGGAGSEPRLLSSRATWFYKIVTPALGAIALVSMVAQPFVLPPPLRPYLWLVVAVVVALTAITSGWLVSIKQVRLDGDDLLVSNFRDEVRVPLREIVRVEASRFTNPDRIRLHLRFETPFGARITFLPPLRWKPGFSPHPLAQQLQARIAGDAAAIAPDTRRLRTPWIAALVGAGVVALNVLVFGALRSNEAYRTAVAIARADARLVAALGEPIEEGWLVTGNVEAGGDGAAANLAFSLYGPKADAAVQLRASKHAGQWRHEALVARVESGPEIDLLAPAAE